jgi:PAS domain S-box-containing protein
LFDTIAGTSDGYISCIDRNRQILYLNRALSRDLSDIVGRSMEEFISPEHREQTISQVELAFETFESQSLSYHATLGDGARRYLTTKIVPFSAPSGEPLALMTTRDDTEKHELYEQLERSIEFRRKVVENLPDYIALIDRGQRIVWINRPPAGLAVQDVIGMDIARFSASDTLPLVETGIEKAFSEGAVSQFEARASRDGQATDWYLTRVAPIVSEGAVENVLLVTSNITEQKRAESELRTMQAQLHLAQRQESIGQLAGGIAHDFNNLLQVLEGTLYFARRGSQAGQSVVEEIDQAVRATERAAELTSHLLAIGRRKRLEAKTIDLGELVEQSLRMLRRAIPENVELCYLPPTEPCFVELDAPHFEQVLINLCVNARDAMPQGGVLTVAIDSSSAADVVLAVTDTGHGIAEQDLTRIFEPFYTTKGAGSGLGLAVAAGIVAAHSGSLVAESELGRGTTMGVRLPRARSSEGSLAVEPTSAPRGSETILVAEDEKLVRAQVVKMLESNGYRVIAAENGKQALQRFAEHRDEIDLVMLDVIMPGMDGWQVYLEIEAERPNMPVLFSTGYASNVLPEDFTTRGARLLNKPFRPSTLLSTVRELLAPRSEPK